MRARPRNRSLCMSPGAGRRCCRCDLRGRARTVRMCRTQVTFRHRRQVTRRCGSRRFPSTCHPGSTAAAGRGAGRRHSSAAHTVTFMTRKPGHSADAGQGCFAAALEVVDIGIPARIIWLIRAGTTLPKTLRIKWADHAAVLCDPARRINSQARTSLLFFQAARVTTGAARMSAMAGLRAGAGLVTHRRAAGTRWLKTAPI